MVERGCKVVGIELDPAAALVAESWAERVIAADIDVDQVWDQLDDESFDVVLCGDVLEHLRDPLAALRSAVRKLKPEGHVVTSLPNVAHGDVRMLLFGGAFRYRELGLLDRTHLRFFTLETIRELLRDAGLLVVETKRIVVPLFGTELEIARHEVAQSTIDGILADPESETYQYVMKSVRDDGNQAVSGLAGQVAELTDHIEREAAGMAKQVSHLNDHVEELEETIGHLRRALAESEDKLQALLATKSFRALAPLRQVYGSLRRRRVFTRRNGS
jgi:hypothetical protein